VDRKKIIKYLNAGILIFLSLHVITSQWSVASSSIGLGGLIILASVRIIVSRNVFVPEKNLLYLFGALILVYLTASVFSIDALSSFSNSRRVLLFTGFFAAVIFIKNLKELKIIITILFLFTAFISILELIKYYIDFSIHSETPFYEQRIQYFGYPITNAEIKMLILLLMVSLLLIKDKFVMNKIWIGLLTVPVFFSLYFTSSRNALLGLFAGLITLGILKNKYFLAAIIFIVILFLIAAPLPVKERVISIVDFNHPSIQSRFIIWETGIKIIKDYPILGIGDTDISKVYENYKPIERHGEGSHLHNNFLQVLATVGIAGFLVWLALMVYIFIRQIKIYFLTKNYPVLSSLTSASIACMIAFQISGLTEWNFGDFEFAAVLWFMLGLSFLAEKFYNNTNSTDA
jgi:putative inorganic carbon (hco3(-)) transporter